MATVPARSVARLTDRPWARHQARRGGAVGCAAIRAGRSSRAVPAPAPRRSVPRAVRRRSPARRRARAGAGDACFPDVRLLEVRRRSWIRCPGGGARSCGRRSPDGEHSWQDIKVVHIDLTREQFQRGQVVSAACVVWRPAGPLPRHWAEYQLLRSRVEAHLGTLPPAAGGTEPDTTSPG
ncbi:YunG family protein [Streptomyces sp. MA5143a]|uniref:YunG family protein n=1 Tax=Streptomyces sp. MA5143a TaxID=2083010 RepID=UPI003F8EC655